MTRGILDQVVAQALRYRESLVSRPVGAHVSRAGLAARADDQLPDAGEPPESAIDALVKAAEHGLVGSASGRYFGFVIGGSPLVSVAADWLTSVWDQNAQVYGTSPAAALVEEIVRAWLLDLLDLPREAGMGFVTGAQMANFAALSVARNELLRRHGWDFDSHGLQGAPRIHVVCGECAHGTVLSAVRMMGLGTRNVRAVEADDQGRICPKILEAVLEECHGPTVVCAQAGNVNTGAFDPFVEVAALARAHGAWLHVDGAFGLWARAAPALRHLCTGAENADSWATDAHKWPGVPYDSGLVILRDAAAHRSLKTQRCAYAGAETAAHRDGFAWVPENSRRARGFVLYATLRHLGRRGVARIVEGCCAHARALATGLASIPDAHVLNDVVLNQVLCRFAPQGIADLDAFNEAVAERIQRAGECWLGTTRWRDRTVLRLSVSNLETSNDDVALALASIRDAATEELRAR
jgi:glutamate/tyrosine decarboxylase-like PLP-dependent enzyme